MYCQNCGSKNTDDAFYCENCGEKLEVQDSPFWNANEPVVKKPVSKSVLIIAVELVCIGFLIYGMISGSKKLFSAEHEAENFFVYMQNGDFLKAYEKLDVAESDFICAELFQKVQANADSQVIGNYQIKSNDQMNMLPQANALSKEVTIQFQSEGNSYEYPITLNKQLEKKYVLFDDWKVDAGKFICKEYMIYVPKGAKVVLDDIRLHDPYRITEQMAESQSDSPMDIYQIPEIFCGSHTITVSMKDMESVKQTIKITNIDQEYRLNTMHMKKEAAKGLLQAAGKNMESIYNAALCGQDFQKIASIFTSNQEMLLQIKEDYEYLVSNLQAGDTKPYSIQFYNINASVSSDDSSSLHLSFAYDLAYTYKDWWSGEIQKDVYSGNEELTFAFRKEKGTWVQGNLGCESLYY